APSPLPQVPASRTGSARGSTWTRRCAGSPTTSGSRSCCATCATSTTRRSPRCSTCRPGRSSHASPGGARSSWNDWTRAPRGQPAPGTAWPPLYVRTTMADDRPDDQRDERIATWLEAEPLDELTRRRLVAGAMQATAEAPSSAPSRRAWRWIATAAVIVVVLVGALAVFTARGGDESRLSDARQQRGGRSDQI